MRISISLLLICFTLSACASTVNTNTQEIAVVHVVLIWLKQPGNQEHAQQLIKVSKQLKQIPYIQEMQVGKSIPSDRKIVDDSFDVGLYMAFANQDNMERYLVHPEHIKVVTKTLMPLTSKILVYDIAIHEK